MSHNLAKKWATDAENPQHVELASLSSRLVAQFIDVVIGLLILIPASGAASTPLSEFSEISALTILLSFSGFVAYILFADSFSKGQSLGKRLIHISVIDEKTGKPCSVIKSFVRNLSLICLGFIDWLLIFGRDRQRLGDMLARTKVIKGRSVL